MIAAMTALLIGAALISAGSAATPKWTRLYNGRDLTGWHVEGEGAKLDAWKAAGPILSCVKPGGGYLARDEEYGDFELRLEYRIPPAGNSGVGIRFPRGGWPSTDGMEIQILDDDAPAYKDLKPEQAGGSLYTFVAPSRKPQKPPGTWNKMFIRCQGPRVVVKINNVEVIDASMDDHPEKGKGTVPLKDRPRRGLIGLQSHGDPVDFRNIEIRELK
jgi:hypothetical protein